MTALVVDVLITALWPLIGAAGLRDYGAVPFMSAGMALGALSVLPWLALEGRWRRVVSGGAARALALMGLFSAAPSLIYVIALAYTTPVNAVILAQVEIVYSVIISAAALGEKPTLKQSLASALVIGGTALIVARDLRSPRWRGDLMILGSAWMYQVSHAISKKLPRDLDSWTLAGGRLFYGALILAPAAAWALSRGARWSWAPGPLGTLALEGVLACSANIVLWYVALRGLDLSKATTIMLSYPAATLVFSWLWTHEPVAGVQVAGLAATVGGAAWTARLAAQAS